MSHFQRDSTKKPCHQSSIDSLPFFPLFPPPLPPIANRTASKEVEPPFLNTELFKIRPCHIKKQHNHKQCMFYHGIKDRRRKNKDYLDEICIFMQNNEECQLGDDCPFSHNPVEERYMPRNYKKKFCYYFEISKLENCEYGKYCSYAHSEEEVKIELLHKIPEDENFFVYKFKTVMCPFFNLKHDKGTCVYAHNYQDYRRPPNENYYELQSCPFWKYDAYVQDYKDGCPYGKKCPNCHGWKEYDFHPLHYKTTPCPNGSRCYKNVLCPFYHDESDRRKICKIKNPKFFQNSSRNPNIIKMTEIREEDINAKYENRSQEAIDLTNKSTAGSFKSVSNHDSSTEGKPLEIKSSSKKLELSLENIQVYKSLFFE